MKDKQPEQKEEVIPSGWGCWKTMAGYVYLIICIFDFVVMPALVYAGQQDAKEFLHALPTDNDKAFTIQILDRTQTIDWQPVTMVGGGLFHISFGAILTGVAVTRGPNIKLPGRK